MNRKTYTEGTKDLVLLPDFLPDDLVLTNDASYIWSTILKEFPFLTDDEAILVLLLHQQQNFTSIKSFKSPYKHR